MTRTTTSKSSSSDRQPGVCQARMSTGVHRDTKASQRTAGSEAAKCEEIKDSGKDGHGRKEEVDKVIATLASFFKLDRGEDQHSLHGNWVTQFALMAMAEASKSGENFGSYMCRRLAAFLAQTLWAASA